MRSSWVVGVVFVVACGDNIAGPPATPDAGPRPLRVFLEFEGVTLQPPPAGTLAPSSRTNTTSVVTAPTTVPPYLDGDPNRADTIAKIVSETTARLAPLHLAVVTERPIGEYFLIVVTGPPSVIGFSNGISAVTYFGCSATPPDLAPHHDGVALLFQSGAGGDSYGPVDKGNLVVPVLGLANNIPPTTARADCMCFAAASCNNLNEACTLGGPGTAVDTAHACPGAPATVDELGLFIAEFGAH